MQRSSAPARLPLLVGALVIAQPFTAAAAALSTSPARRPAPAPRVGCSPHAKDNSWLFPPPTSERRPPRVVGLRSSREEAFAPSTLRSAQPLLERIRPRRLEDRIRESTAGLSTGAARVTGDRLRARLALALAQSSSALSRRFSLAESLARARRARPDFRGAPPSGAMLEQRQQVISPSSAPSSRRPSTCDDLMT